LQDDSLIQEKISVINHKPGSFRNQISDSKVVNLNKVEAKRKKKQEKLKDLIG
jgi:hypothetical protein